MPARRRTATGLATSVAPPRTGCTRSSPALPLWARRLWWRRVSGHSTPSASTSWRSARTVSQRGVPSRSSSRSTSPQRSSTRARPGSSWRASPRAAWRRAACSSRAASRSCPASSRPGVATWWASRWGPRVPRGCCPTWAPWRRGTRSWRCPPRDSTAMAFPWCAASSAPPAWSTASPRPSTPPRAWARPCCRPRVSTSSRFSHSRGWDCCAAPRRSPAAASPAASTRCSRRSWQPSCGRTPGSSRLSCAGSPPWGRSGPARWPRPSTAGSAWSSS
mmetsp:Transcript_87426/g.270686  ORF Transcript_87426/g.270686 Transcript_87426/m.270686 type:complete len:276 (+) Transcript_87426:975-1802(+)